MQSSTVPHRYRTHTCGELRTTHVGMTARLSGWIHTRRDHGGIVFIDLRDHYGLTQLVLNPNDPLYAQAARLPRESTVTVTGRVMQREAETINPALATGEVELWVEECEVLSQAQMLPFSITDDNVLELGAESDEQLKEALFRYERILVMMLGGLIWQCQTWCICFFR